jgi:hypothetical protein
LKASPVRKAPFSPISWKQPERMEMRAAPVCQPVAMACISTISAKAAVSTSISADSRSSTSTMPKGAGQSPSR